MTDTMLVPCARTRRLPPLDTRAAPSRSSHRLLSDGGVKVSLPRDGVLTDGEAKRLAWAILADLAPDQVLPTAQVVTYLEGRRLSVLHAVAAGHRTYAALIQCLGGSKRAIDRRVAELLGDGRLEYSARPAGNRCAEFRVCTEDRA